MSLSVILASCVFACDFAVYLLFKWMYGERRRRKFRRSRARNAAFRTQRRNPLPVPSAESAFAAQRFALTRADSFRRGFSLPRVPSPTEQPEPA
jgi:hypothetical protein